jgi:hypothetical protein
LLIPVGILKPEGIEELEIYNSYQQNVKKSIPTVVIPVGKLKKALRLGE